MVLVLSTLRKWISDYRKAHFVAGSESEVEELKRLRKENSILKMERDILKNLFQDFATRCRWIMKHKKEYPLAVMTKVLKVSRSGYYEFCHRKESLRSATNRQLSSEIKAAFTKSNATYGSLRIHKALGKKCSRAKVARLMKREGLQSVWRRKYKPQTTVVDATSEW